MDADESHDRHPRDRDPRDRHPRDRDPRDRHPRDRDPRDRHSRDRDPHDGDPYDLDRFVAAQEAGRSYQRAVAELRAGRKTGHWIWFVFPQIAGLGHSPASVRYSISSLAEARAYLAHPVLGRRLAECTRILALTEGRSAEQILGDIDAMKLRSCMTLFHRAEPDDPLFAQIIGQYFGHEPDRMTDQILASLS